MSEESVGSLVRALGEGVQVADPPVDSVLLLGRRRSRGRRLAISGLVVGCTLLAIVAGVVISDSGVRGPDRIAPAHGNALPVPWWGDGTLHLANLTLRAPGLTQLVQVGDAVAYSTTNNDVIIVQPDGEQTTVSHQAYVGPMAGSTEQGWVTWVDPNNKNPQLVVYDISQQAELGRLTLLYRGSRWGRLDSGQYPLSIDNGRVYYAGEDGDWSWAPGETTPERISPANLDVLDVRAGYRLQHAWTVDNGWTKTLSLVDPEGGTVSYEGNRGSFSPGATYVAVTSGKGLQLFRRGSKGAITLDLPERRGDHREAGLGPEYSFAGPSTLILASGGQLRPSPTRSNVGLGIPAYETWDISTCNLETGKCSTLTDATHAPPILPQ